MKWKGKELKTMGDIMDFIIKCDSKEDAREFMKLYSQETPHAYQNVGYAAGYYDNKTKHRIFDWFQTAHPVFGTTDPTPEEAFKAGQKMAKSVTAEKKARR